MQDITDTLADINPTDRVFAHDGRFYKVRLIRKDPPPGAPDFGVVYLQVSGSETGPDGRALPHGAGYRIGQPWQEVIHADAPVDAGALIDQVRQECVERTHAQAVAQDQFDNLPI